MNSVVRKEGWGWRREGEQILLYKVQVTGSMGRAKIYRERLP
jgi:hypothetical protein